MPPSGIRRFFDILATMDDVISLGVGEPDFDTPERIVAAGVRSLHNGRTHYTSNYGTVELRNALADHLERRYGAAYDPASELLITVGASEAVDLALRATCDPGDEVVLHEPCYVAYVPAIVFAGGVVRHVATHLDDDFALDPAAVEAAITPQTKALFLGFPCNPTGAVLPDDVQEAIAEIAVRHDLLVYSDEIYDRLAYGDVPASPVQHAARHARADDRDGRVQQGLRDDRLAGRLAGRSGRDSRGDREGPPVRDHVGADRGPGRSARGAPERRGGRRADGRGVRPPPAARRRRAQRARPADVRAARRVLRVPRGHHDYGNRARRHSPRACSRRSGSR